MTGAARRARVLAVAYLASGAAALILEVAWSRLLLLQFGHTTGATSTVLAAFMGGLAGGSALGGRLAERSTARQALRWYAALELFVAISALALPLAIGAAGPLLEYANVDGRTPMRFALARTGISLGALTIPTLAMGATFPLAVRGLVFAGRNTSELAGRLYAINALGAAVGALAAGFMLLPALGTRMTTAVAAMLNVGAAALGWWLSVGCDEPLSPAAPRAKDQPAGRLDLLTIGLAATGASGFVALASQVAWTRVLALLLGPTTFAFSAMLAVFLTGVAGGAALGTRLARSRRPALWLGLASLAAAASTLASILATGRLLLWVGGAAGPSATFTPIIWQQIAVAAILVGPLAMACGAAFPLALAVVGRGALTPTRLAAAYVANTAGSVAGSLLAGFLLIPALGLQTTLRLCAVVSMVTGAGIIIAAARGRGRAAAVLGVTLLAGAVTRAEWDPALLSSGAYRFAPAVPREDLDDVLAAGDLLFYDEGAAATVAVRRLAGTTSLVIDGKPDASTAGDMLTQKLLAHVPLLLHAAPTHVNVIGLGSGVTAGAALTHAIARLDVAEISPEVVNASQFFRAENRNALTDPRTRLLLGDGRSHLRLGRSRYDVVISEPSNPWMAGIAALFTREFLIEVRERLTEDGIFCQWAHTYDISDPDLRSIVATFVDVFPHASLWLIGEADVLLVGSRAPLELDRAAMATRFARAAVADDLRRVSVGGVDDLLGLYLGDTAALRSYAATFAPQTDDRMSLEFSAPRGLVSRAGRGNVTTLLGLRSHPPAATADQWKSRGRMLLAAEAYELAFAALTRAAALGSADEETLALLERAAAGAGKTVQAIEQLRHLIHREPGMVAVRVALARLLIGQGDIPGARTILEAAPESAPDARIATALASLFADAGDIDRLVPIVAGLGRLWPGAPDTRYFTAALAFLQGDAGAALEVVESPGAPADARTQNLIGAAHATLGRYAQARAAFERAAAADPRDANVHVNAGRLELEAGRRDLARRHFATALAIDPASDGAREGLTAVR